MCARVSAFVRARPSQVALTCRPLRNDEKCGKGEDADLAAGHAGAAAVGGRGIVPHGGSKNPVLQYQHWARPQSGLESRSWMAGWVGGVVSSAWLGLARLGPAAAAPKRHRPVPLKEQGTAQVRSSQKKTKTRERSTLHTPLFTLSESYKYMFVSYSLVFLIAGLFKYHLLTIKTIQKKII